MSQLKQLIFGPPYPEILFTGEKTKTFRVTGGDNYHVGEFVIFCYPDLEEFARARILDKLHKTFETLSPIDWQGHERFKSEAEMYKVYSAWEGRVVGPKTELDILVYDNFRLTGKSRFEQSLPKITTLPEVGYCGALDWLLGEKR